MATFEAVYVQRGPRTFVDVLRLVTIAAALGLPGFVGARWKAEQLVPAR
jgi:hypothetical protein